MNDTRKTYETPELEELGTVAELTKETGWGLEELLASIVSGGPISVGKCSGTCFS